MAGLLGQAGVEFGQQLLALAQVALAVLLGGAVEVGAGVDPVAVAVLLDEAAPIAEAAQGITEHADRLARHHAGELHALIADPLAQGIRIRGGADVEGCGPPACRR